MATLRILDGSGHTAVEWELDAEDAIAEAEKIFEQNKKKGMTAFDTSTTPAMKIDKFNPNALSITMVPRVAGGDN